MHELSICKAIADTALDHAGGHPVSSIKLRIGHFRQVVPETLLFCWDLRNSDGALANCSLEVEYVPAVIECATCDAVTTLTDPVLICGACNGSDVAMISGEEFLIESIDLAPADNNLTEEVS